jgi:histidinol-phosphate aminotransferase
MPHRVASAALLSPRFAAVPTYGTANTQTGAVRLASNENPYGPSPRVADALQQAMLELHRYPDPSASRLRATIASHHGVKPSNVLVGNGATELIDLIAKATLDSTHNAVYAQPSFVMYRIASLSQGAAVHEVALGAGGEFDLEAILGAVTADTKLVYLANPNNPTGTYINDTALRAFIAALPAHVLLVLDEAYREYAVADDFPDGLDMLGLRDRIVVLRTFSKCYGLAGLRVGYLFAPNDVIACLERARLPFNVNALAQAAAAAALKDPAHIARCRAENRAQMMVLVEELDALGCEVTPSQANFLLVNFHDETVVDRLARHGVLIRSMAPYGLPKHGRITVGAAEDNAVLINALWHVFQEIERRPAA